MLRYFFLKNKNAFVAVLIATFLLAGCATSPGGGSRQGEADISEDDVALFQSAMMKIEKEDYQQGIALLNELTGRSRQSAVPFINLAMAYKKQGDNDKAEENLLLALEIESKNPVANNEYAILLRESGRFDESRALYEKVITWYPNFAMANRNLGVLCDIYLRDYSCALEAYRAYSALLPDDEDARMWVSDLEWRVKQQGGG